MLRVCAEIVHFIAIGGGLIGREHTSKTPKAGRRLGPLADPIDAFANLAEKPARAVKFIRFGFAQCKDGPRAAGDQELAGVTDDQHR